MSVPLAYLGLVLVWTTTPLAIKWSGESVGFLFGISMRLMIALVFSLLLIMVLRKAFPWDKTSLRLYVAIGFPVYLSMASVYWGAQFVSSGMISILFGLTPIFTGLFASIWLNEKSFTLSKILGMVMGIFGLIIIFYPSIDVGDVVFFGMLAVLSAVFFHAFGTVWVKSLNHRLPVFTANTGGLTVASLLFIIHWIVAGEKLPEMVPSYVGYSIAYLAIIGSVFGALLFYYALKHVSATSIGLLPLITPVTCTLLGQWLNDEVVSTSTIVGAGVILSGLFVYQWAALMPMIKRSRVAQN